MAFNNHFAHYSLFSYSKSQGNSFSHTCCLYCPAYLTAVAFSDRTRHGMPDEMLIGHLPGAGGWPASECQQYRRIQTACRHRVQ
ncbi:TPA: hypothetical protein MI694_00915 [Klebsiella pneumoniae]|nr:hypothetical protein [Klebsiella pneumoniae]